MSIQKDYQNRKIGKRGITDYKKEKNIHDAATEGDLESVIELVELSPSEIWKTDEISYMSALHYAAQYGHLEVAKYLLNQKADINRKSKSGETALHLACLKGHEPMVKLLLVRGADTTITNFHKQGTYTVRQTALELAEELQFTEIVKTFEKFKAWDAKRIKEEKLLQELRASQEKELTLLKERHTKEAQHPDFDHEAHQAEELVLLEQHEQVLTQFYAKHTTQKPPEKKEPVVANETQTA